MKKIIILSLLLFLASCWNSNVGQSKDTASNMVLKKLQKQAVDRMIVQSRSRAS